MKSVNEVRIVGALGQDPEKNVYRDTVVAKFSVATNHKKGNKDITEWHNVVVFNKQAEKCVAEFKKGNWVEVCGRLQTSKWENDQGEKRTKIEIIAESLTAV